MREPGCGLPRPQSRLEMPAGPGNSLRAAPQETLSQNYPAKLHRLLTLSNSKIINMCGFFFLKHPHPRTFSMSLERSIRKREKHQLATPRTLLDRVTYAPGLGIKPPTFWLCSNHLIYTSQGNVCCCKGLNVEIICYKAIEN